MEPSPHVGRVLSTAEYSAVCWRAVDYRLEITAQCYFPIQVPEGWIQGSLGLLDVTVVIFIIFFRKDFSCEAVLDLSVEIIT